MREINCDFVSVVDVFNNNIEQAEKKLSTTNLDDYIKNAEFLAKIGQGDTLSIEFLKVMPWVGEFYGDGSIDKVTDFAYNAISKTPNKKSVPRFFKSLIPLIEYTNTKQLDEYLNLIKYFLQQTTFSVHNGIHDTHPSPSFEDFLQSINKLLEQLDFKGIYNWIDYGLRYFKHHPERQKEYFSLQTQDSKTAFQRQRKGLLFIDAEKRLDIFQQALFNNKFIFAPYSPDFENLEHFQPYLEDGILRLPDICSKEKPLERYFALIAHIYAHKKHTTKIVADNISPQQRFFAEIFEDARVEYLLIKQYAGLKKLWLNLIPIVDEFICDESRESCLRHRGVMLARALLDENHPYKNVVILEFVAEFKKLMQQENSTKDSLNLGLRYLIKTRNKSDAKAKVYFDNTEITYRDDNRLMWLFIEEFDEDDEIFSRKDKKNEKEVTETIPPHYYDEWDYNYNSYKLDWAAVYERAQANGDGLKIDKILDKHKNLVKQLKKILDLLKPQNKKRLRYQEEGSELDLDVALKSVINIKNGDNPDNRINIDFEHDSRSVSVLLLLDLSESLNEVVSKNGSTILELSIEAVSILSWAIEQLGDNFAIAGFNSNTRNKVMYYHIKSYKEQWSDDVKGRLATLKAEFSTRMGAAMRHGAHYLNLQQSDKKLMLILTDGEPADIDIADDRSLIMDAHKAVQEIKMQGIYPHCISLDNKADKYIGDIFNANYSIIDKIEDLPKQLPQLFLSLTK